ncbi:uncharacterized protein LOC122060995 [Macadamia integrifolia]|uniref:uncharacterized protein LOC122060995 n=1 Tax=Macadamia integrifolia TaxID=60698 RepID=UPI001C527799|nr:uncharacterized protein LOC122060995 [Macadamia integrifolia]
MVVALGPGKFYGSSLPRPRIYTDVKLSDDGSRVDPPLPVLDPFLTWANDAHWSMGGFSFKRLRLQGRIEGSIKKLRAQQERTFKRKKKPGMNKKPTSTSVSPSSFSLSPRLQALLLNEDDADEESEKEEEEVARTPLRKNSARKLRDDFDKSASADAAVVSTVTARKGNSKGKSKVPGNDSPVSIETSMASPQQKNRNRSSEPTTNSVPRSSPLPRRRRALLLNEDDPEVEEPESSPARLQKNRRSSANEKTSSSSPLSAIPDGVAFRTRGRRLEEGNATAGSHKSIKRRQ